MDKVKKPKMSKTSEKLLNEFDQAAKSHGWHEDQGSGKAVINAEEQYEDAKAALAKRVLFLEQQVTRLSARVIALSASAISFAKDR